MQPIRFGKMTFDTTSMELVAPVEKKDEVMEDFNRIRKNMQHQINQLENAGLDIFVRGDLMHVPQERLWDKENHPEGKYFPNLVADYINRDTQEVVHSTNFGHLNEEEPMAFKTASAMITNAWNLVGIEKASIVPYGSSADND